MKTLKIILISSTLLFLFSFYGHGQGVRFLPQAGLNLTQLSDDPSEDSDKFRPGVEAGLWVQTKNPVFFQPGLFYGQQRLNKIKLNDVPEINGDTILNKVDYRCIRLPLMFGIQVFGARIYTGPTFTYIINVDDVQYADNGFKDLSMGLNVGAGLNITFLSFDLRYEYGITDRFENSNARTNTITFSAGFKF